MSVLEISLFGSLRVIDCGSREEIKLTHTIGHLLAYLLLERHRMHPREALAGLFWAEYNQERARSCLNTALWRLRRSLEIQKSPIAPFLIANEGEVGFNCASSFWLDVAVFEECLSSLFKHPVDQVNPDEMERAEKVIQLYQGELLEGAYEDWAIRAREQMRLLYLHGLMHLMQYYKHQRNYERALNFGMKVLQIDPLREEIHREVMRIHLAKGERVTAIQQYQVCQRYLAEELGIQPMEETQQLFRQILDGSTVEPKQPSPGSVEGWRQIMQQLQQANQNFDLAREQYNRALQYLERWVGEQG